MNKAMNDGKTPLLMAVQEGHMPVVQYLVQEGADMNKADIDGATPFYVAAYFRHMPLVQYLGQQGADINITTKVKEGRGGMFDKVTRGRRGRGSRRGRQRG